MKGRNPPGRSIDFHGSRPPIRRLLLVLIAAAQLALPAPAPQQKSAAELRAAATADALGVCIAAASMRLTRSMKEDDKVLAAAYVECEPEEASARDSYGAYLKEIGMALSPE